MSNFFTLISQINLNMLRAQASNDEPENKRDDI